MPALDEECPSSHLPSLPLPPGLTVCSKYNWCPRWASLCTGSVQGIRSQMEKYTWKQLQIRLTLLRKLWRESVQVYLGRSEYMLNAQQKILTILFSSSCHSQYPRIWQPCFKYLFLSPTSQSQCKILPIPFPSQPLLLTPSILFSREQLFLFWCKSPAFPSTVPSLSTWVQFCLRKAEDLAGKAELCLVGRVARKLNGQGYRYTFSSAIEGREWELERPHISHFCPLVGSKYTDLFRMVRNSIKQRVILETASHYMLLLCLTEGSPIIFLGGLVWMYVLTQTEKVLESPWGWLIFILGEENGDPETKKDVPNIAQQVSYTTRDGARTGSPA